MSKALAIDFSTSNTGYAFRNPLRNEYVVGSIAGGKSKDPLERAKIKADGITEVIEHYNLFDYFIYFIFLGVLSSFFFCRLSMCRFWVLGFRLGWCVFLFSSFAGLFSFCQFQIPCAP